MTQRTLHGLFLLLVLALLGQPAANALVKVDSQSIDLALKYGMQNQEMGYSALLGANWMEGPDGSLLNIYTPFMVLASKSYKGGFPENPSKADIKKARTKYARVIRDLTDSHIPLEIKFAVSLYGDDPAFGQGYRAYISGFGRGKTFTIKPFREIRQKTATQDAGVTENPYAAINAYYFKFEELEVLDEYSFILENPAGKKITFRIRNDKIY